MTTYAAAHGITPPARPVRAPCCGHLRAADMIVALEGLPAAAQARVPTRGRRAPTAPLWACDGCRAALHRAGLGVGVPGTR
jgi:hypothetical protein